MTFRKQMIALFLALVMVFGMAPLGTARTAVSYAAEQSPNSVEIKQVLAGTMYETPLYIIRSGKPGPTVLISGGVHGNETAGYTAARQVKDYQISAGTLLVLPEANRPAIVARQRYTSEGDLNRGFPQANGDSAKSTLAKVLFEIFADYDVKWHIDLHEGFDYYNNTKSDSVGQSIIYYPSTQMTTFAKQLQTTLNATISDSYKQFSLLRYPVTGSFARSGAEVYGINSMIFETVTKEPLAQRVAYQQLVVKELLKFAGLQSEQLPHLPLPTPSDEPVDNTPVETPTAPPVPDFEDVLPVEEPSVPPTTPALKPTPKHLPVVKNEEVTLAKGTSYQTTAYVIRGAKPGKTALVLAGAYGTERSGIDAAKKLLTTKLSEGTLIVIPEANRPAIKAGKFTVNNINIDRHFPTSATDKADSQIAREIFDLIKRFNVSTVIELREGSDYYRNTASNAFGNSVIYYPAGTAEKTANSVSALLSKSYPAASKKYSAVKWPVLGSLPRAVGEVYKMPSFIVTTTTKETLARRTADHQTGVQAILASFSIR